MHLTPNISYPLMILVSALMLPVMIVRFYMGVWQMMLLDFPLIVASFWSVSAFYLVAQRELHPKTWKRTILFLPMLMAVGVGLTLINTRAVLEALFGVKSGFVRTPKYAIEGNHAKRMAVRSISAAADGCLTSNWPAEPTSSTCAGSPSRLITIRPSLSLHCLSAAITGLDSGRSGRSIRTVSAITASKAWNSRPRGKASLSRNNPKKANTPLRAWTDAEMAHTQCLGHDDYQHAFRCLP